MRVLHIINNLAIGGAEQLLSGAIPKFLELGLNVEIAILNGTNYPFLKQLEDRGCKVHKLGYGNVYNPLLVFKIIPLIKKFDIVHVHLFPSLYWVAMAKIFSNAKSKLLFTEHSTSNKRRKKFFFRQFDRLVYKKYERIITISKDVDRLIKDHLGYDESKFSLINNGVDIEKMNLIKPHERKEFLGNPSDKIIIQVSRFNKHKDQKTLIRAMSLIDKPVKLLLVGDGDAIGECKEYVVRLGIQDRVIFLGIRLDVYALLKMADIVVLSSNYEGLSLSSIEGLASGRPFIASEVPGLSNIVKGAGILFPNGDEQKLAKEINTLFDNDTYYKEIGNRCLERAKDYSLDKTINQHIKLYNEVCSKIN